MGRKSKYDSFEDFLCLSSYYDVRDKPKNIEKKQRYILNQTNQMFEYDGLPDTIKKRDLELLLQTRGFAIWLEHEGKLYALEGSLGGVLNQNYVPTKAIVANAYLNNLKTEYEIGKDCVLMRGDATNMGLLPLVSYYATEMVENELSMHMVDINTRVQTLLSAGDSNTIKSAEKYIKDIEKGNIGVIANPKFMDEIAGLKSSEYSGASATNAIMNLIEYQQYLDGTLMNKLGVRAPFNMKREALGDSEISQMDMTLIPLIDNMLECRKESVEEINKLFGTNIEVRLSSSWGSIHKEVQDSENLMDDSTEEPKENNEQEQEED